MRNHHCKVKTIFPKEYLSKKWYNRRQNCVCKHTFDTFFGKNKFSWAKLFHFDVRILDPQLQVTVMKRLVVQRDSIDHICSFLRRNTLCMYIFFHIFPDDGKLRLKPVRDGRSILKNEGDIAKFYWKKMTTLVTNSSRRQYRSTSN